jgi:hypothetical protein
VPVPGVIPCSRCEVSYDPRLVGGACPVCSTPAPGHERRTAAPDRALYLVGAATVANMLLLAILAAYLLS